MDSDVIFSELNFFSHVVVLFLIYQQITDIRIALKWYIVTSVILRLSFFISPPIAYFSPLFVLVFYSIYKNHYHNRFLDVFYGLYPTIVASLFSRLLTFHILPLVGINFASLDNSNVMRFLIDIMIFPIHYFLMKLLKVDFHCLQKELERKYLNPFLLLVDLTMVIYFVLVQTLLIAGSNISNSVDYGRYLVIFYLILFLIMLIYMNGTVKEKLREEIISQKERQLVYLSNYSKQIEELYKDIRNFRHDYINVLTSIKLGIDTRDIDVVADVYQTVLVKSGQHFQDNKFNLANLINVKNDAIKSILAAKILEAKSKGININVEVGRAFDTPNIDLIDCIKVLSILLDNAIESVKPESNHKITVALISEKGVDILIVENTTEIEKVDISKIFEHGYSAKGQHRGIGLYNVRTILNKYPQVSLKTQSKNYVFKQTLIIK